MEETKVKIKTGKLSAIMISLLLTIAMLTACGGGGGSSDASVFDNDGKNAEPNNGIQGIVFAVPEGWEQTNYYQGEYSEFGNADTPYTINISITNEDTLKTFEEEEIANMTVEAYYKKYLTPNRKWMKKNNIQLIETKICDSDAYYTKRNSDKGVLGAGATWLYDGVIYDVSLDNHDNYDDQGELKEDVEAASDEAVAALEYLLASARPGDGSAFTNAASGFGSLTFDPPEGFVLTNIGDRFAEFDTEDGKVYINVNMFTEENLDDFTDGDGKHPGSLREEFNNRFYEGMDTIEIGGHEAFIDKYQEEDGKYYMINAAILTDDALYDIYMQPMDEIFDENGLKADATALTDEQVAAFEKFVKSFRDK